MSLDEKMAGRTGVFPFGEDYQDMEKLAAQMPFGIGTVSTLEMREIPTLDEAADWQRNVQKTVMEKSPHHIPAIFHMEGLCGAFIQESTSFPSGIARDRAGIQSWRRRSEPMWPGRKPPAALPISWLRCWIFPEIPEWDGRERPTGRIALASALGAAYTRGAQSTETDGRKPESVAKHFLGFHNSQGGSSRNQQRYAAQASGGRSTARLFRRRFVNPA